MERLPEDVLLTTVTKVTAFGTMDLFRFKATFVLHRKLVSKMVVLRALSRDCLWYISDYCLWYISDYWPCAGKCKFMQKISRSGHEAYCAVMAAQLLQERRSDLEEIKHILQKAAVHGSDEAMYFLLMLKVLAKDGFSMDGAFPIFKDFFNRK